MPAFVFVDLMYRERMPPVRIRAALSLISSDDGGRRSGIRSGYRPNQNFGAPEGREFYIGQIDFESPESIEPGETHEVFITFIQGPGLKERLKPGQTWRIQEGPKLVGMGKVLEVVSET